MAPEVWLLLSIAIFPLSVLLYVLLLVIYPRYLAWRLGVPVSLFMIVWLLRQGIDSRHFIRLALLIRLKELQAETDDLLIALQEGLDVEEFAAWLHTQPTTKPGDEFFSLWEAFQAGTKEAPPAGDLAT